MNPHVMLHTMKLLIPSVIDSDSLDTLTFIIKDKQFITYIESRESNGRNKGITSNINVKKEKTIERLIYKKVTKNLPMGSVLLYIETVISDGI